MARKKMNFKVPVFQGGQHYMTLDYGYTYSDGSFHYGIDLVVDEKNSKGDYIIAFADGVVKSSANNVSGQTPGETGTIGMGNYVIIQHENGFVTRYMHMRKGSVKVEAGDKVKKGQVIGYIGNTGNSTGRHLHFDISHNTSSYGGKLHNNRYYLDPKPYLEGKESIAASESSSSSSHKVVTRTVNVEPGRLLNVRKGPGMNYPVVRTLKRGETVNEYERKISTWVRIGKDEWVSANFLK